MADILNAAAQKGGAGARPPGGRARGRGGGSSKKKPRKSRRQHGEEEEMDDETGLYGRQSEVKRLHPQKVRYQQVDSWSTAGRQLVEGRNLMRCNDFEIAVGQCRTL